MIEDVGSLSGITTKVTANQAILRFLPVPKNRSFDEAGRGTN